MMWMLLPQLAQAGTWETITDPAFWQKIAGHVPTSGIMITLGSGLLDMVLRSLHTQKPKSIMRGVAAIFLGLALLFERIAFMIDGLLGQSATDPTAPVVPPTTVVKVELPPNIAPEEVAPLVEKALEETNAPKP